MNTTLNEWATKQIEAEERAVAKLAADAKALLDNDWVDVDRLTSIVNSIAFSNGEIHAYEPATHAEDFDRLSTYLTLMVTNGAGDTWSGRGNDTRRSQFEGVCRGVERTLEQIQDLARKEAATA